MEGLFSMRPTPSKLKIIYNKCNTINSDDFDHTYILAYLPMPHLHIFRDKAQGVHFCLSWADKK